MTTVGGKFTTQKRNLVTYIEHKQYELLKRLASLNGRSVSAEAALAIQIHLDQHLDKLEEMISE